jgi:hypothetical protein
MQANNTKEKQNKNKLTTIISWDILQKKMQVYGLL